LYELFETLQAISLGLFVNSSYAIMIGDQRISNWYISIVSVISIIKKEIWKMNGSIIMAIVSTLILLFGIYMLFKTSNYKVKHKN